MRPEELERGYAWLYQRIFGHRSIWARRPEDPRAVPAYLAMSYLYKRSNALWQFLIARNMTQLAWRPLVEWTRLRHTRFREELERRPTDGPNGEVPRDPVRLPTVVYASV